MFGETLKRCFILGTGMLTGVAVVFALRSINLDFGISLQLSNTAMLLLAIAIVVLPGLCMSSRSIRSYLYRYLKLDSDNTVTQGFGLGWVRWHISNAVAVVGIFLIFGSLAHIFKVSLNGFEVFIICIFSFVSLTYFNLIRST